MKYKGKTALITGASSGIGFEYAKELAARGCNLILVARREERLLGLAKEIAAKYSVSVDTVALDLSTADAGEKLLKKLGTVQPDILINNAGFGTSGLVAKENRDRVREEITLNVTTLVDLSTALLPSMLAKNSGAIVNIASTAAFQPVPGMAVYAATKAFVLSFTSALWGEVVGTGVRVLAVCPGATATEFFDVAGAKPFGNLAPVSAVIRDTFKQLDKKSSGPAVVVGGMNSFMAKASSLLPRAAVTKAAGSMFLPKK